MHKIYQNLWPGIDARDIVIGIGGISSGNGLLSGHNEQVAGFGRCGSVSKQALAKRRIIGDGRQFFPKADRRFGLSDFRRVFSLFVKDVFLPGLAIQSFAFSGFGNKLLHRKQRLRFQIGNGAAVELKAVYVFGSGCFGRVEMQSGRFSPDMTDRFGYFGGQAGEIGRQAVYCRKIIYTSQLSLSSERARI